MYYEDYTRPGPKRRLIREAKATAITELTPPPDINGQILICCLIALLRTKEESYLQQLDQYKTAKYTDNSSWTKMFKEIIDHGDSFAVQRSKLHTQDLTEWPKMLYKRKWLIARIFPTYDNGTPTQPHSQYLVLQVVPIYRKIQCFVLIF